MGGTDVESLRIRKFEVGDLVFAKLRGYPPWPSKINQIESTVSGGKETIRYNVYFYGTHQSSILKSSCLFHYDTYAKSIVDKWGRRPKFHEALEELERELMAKIAYLKELRNKPDPAWGPSFSNACDGLLTEIQDSNAAQDTHTNKNKEKANKTKSSPTKKRVISDTESEWDEESLARGHEILYMDRIPFPDTREFLLVISLGFNKDWVREEGKRIQEEERMMNCHVQIEPFPEEYEYLIKNKIDEVHEPCAMSFSPPPPSATPVLSTHMSQFPLPPSPASTPPKSPAVVSQSEEALNLRQPRKASNKEAEVQRPWKVGNPVSRSRKRRGRKRRRRKLSDDSDSDSVMETCPVCRLCFFSQLELKQHELVHASQDQASIVDGSLTNTDESETDIIFELVKPVASTKFMSNNSSDIILSDGPDWLDHPAFYLKEGHPLDSFTPHEYLSGKVNR